VVFGGRTKKQTDFVNECIGPGEKSGPKEEKGRPGGTG